VKRLVPFLIIVCAACLERTDVFEVSSAANSILTTSGSLACTPSSAQTEGCASKAAGDACTDILTDGRIAFSGICRATLDGAGLACAPGHTPPREAIDACIGKAAGDACQPGHHYPAGVCTGIDATLACALQHPQPAFEVAACTNLDAGEGCTLPGHFDRVMQASADAGVIDGTCVAAAGDAGSVACRPFSHEERACAGLAAGAACALGPTCGTCEAPASGGAALCVVSCNSPFFGESFGGYEGHHRALADGGCAADAGN
jgi:hypothetical protein